MPRSHAPSLLPSPRRPRAALALLAAWACSLPLAHAAGAGHGAHSHGLARLDIAVESDRITLQFSSPLDNLLGFERAPRNDKERQLADATIATLNDAASMFRIDPAGQCKPAKVTLSSAALKLGGVSAADEKSDHADIDGTFEFTCATPAKAAHVDLGLFAFKRLQRLEVQVAAPGGQFKRTATAAAPRVALRK